jgi:hypothetical protein
MSLGVFIARFCIEVNECNRLWLLKNSIFLETAKIWGIENVQENSESRLWGFLAQSFFDQFWKIEFFNSHA